MNNKQITLSGVAVVTILSGLFFGIPSAMRYQRLKSAENEMHAKVMDGKANLGKAQYERKIAIEEAEAKKASAQFLGEAEEIRAKYLAKAMNIISQKLKDNPEYLTYLWIQGLQDGNSEVIYVPTEANMPIMEATRGLSSVLKGK